MKTLTFVLLFLPLTALSQYPQSQALPDAYTLPTDTIPPTPLRVNTIYTSVGGMTMHGGRSDPWTIEQFGEVESDSAITDLIWGTQYRAFIPRLLSDWKAYTEECESQRVKHDRLDKLGYVLAMKLADGDTVNIVTDSTRVYYTLGPKFGIGNGEAFEYPRFYWTHKRPTLPGFMLYLERKYLDRKTIR